MEARWETALVEWSEEWRCFTRTLFAPLWNQTFAISWAMRIQIMIDDQDQCLWDWLLCRKQSNPRNPISFNPGRIMNQGLAPHFKKFPIPLSIFCWYCSKSAIESFIGIQCICLGSPALLQGHTVSLFSSLLNSFSSLKHIFFELKWKIGKHYGIIVN